VEVRCSVTLGEHLRALESVALLGYCLSAEHRPKLPVLSSTS
jgi:hypothetical protein